MTKKIDVNSPGYMREKYRLLFIQFVATNSEYDGLDRKKLTELYLDYVKDMINQCYDM